MVRLPNNQVELHRWQCGEWCKVGDVTGSTKSGGQKQLYMGKEYDYVFDVQLDEGERKGHSFIGLYNFVCR